MKTAFSFSTFAKEIGFESPCQKGFRKTLNYLTRIRAVEIQQGGFKGDSIHHKKLVIVKDWYTVVLHLGAKIEETELESPKRKVPKLIQKPPSFTPVQATEKLGIVAYFTVRRHSRVLYLPLDPIAVGVHDIEKGDIVKAKILELWKAPRPDEYIAEPKSEWEEE